jgi:hypothetical protein
MELGLVIGVAAGLLTHPPGLLEHPRQGAAPSVRSWTYASAAGPVSISLSRDACYGIRPVYEITVDRGGTVRFIGRAGIGIVQGLHTTQIRPAQVQELLAEFDKAGFASFRDRYDECVMTGAETVILSLSVGKHHKTVVRSSQDKSAPEALAGLADTIDRIVGTRRGLGDGTFPDFAVPVDDRKTATSASRRGRHVSSPTTLLDGSTDAAP